MINTKYTIREQNEALILQKIIDEHTISRASLSTLTNLNKASVSSITKKLLDEQLISEVGIGVSSNIGGRKPILLEFNGLSALSLSLDIGTDYIEGILSFIDGKIIKKIKHRKMVISNEKIIVLIKSIIKDLLEIEPETPHGIVGLSIAIHGTVNNNNIIFTPNYSLDKIDLLKLLEEQYNFPIFIENEANLAALGEYAFSSKSNNLISISIHSGIGAGIVENGLLKQGKHGNAGEIGHSILYPNGKLCPCGNHGCLEQYISNNVLYKEIESILSLENLTSEDIQYHYNQGNQEVITILEENINLLSVGINNLSVLFDPDLVIINSSVYQKIPSLLDKLQQKMVSNFSKDIILQNSPLQNNATLLGGTIKVAQNFLNIDNLKFIK